MTYHPAHLDLLQSHKEQGERTERRALRLVFAFQFLNRFFDWDPWDFRGIFEIGISCFRGDDLNEHYGAKRQKRYPVIPAKAGILFLPRIVLLRHRALAHRFRFRKDDAVHVLARRFFILKHTDPLVELRAGMPIFFCRRLLKF